MNPSDVTMFVKQLVLSSEAAKMVPLEARMEYCQKVIKFSNEQEGKEQVPDDGRKWKEVGETAERWRGHLDLLRSDTFLKLQNSEDQILCNYANKFALSGGSEEPLRALACRVLLEGSSMEILQEVLSVYPEEAACAPEDVLLQALRIILSFWKNQDVEVAIDHKELCEYDMMKVLDHILSQIATYLSEGGELLSEEEVLQDLRALGEDAAVPLTIRVEALSLAEKHLSLSEEDLQVVCVLRTGSVVACGWLDEEELDIPLDQVSCSEGRAALLAKLIAHTKTLQQAQALIDLLKLWPPFGDDKYQDSLTNPWLSVFRKIIEATKNNNTPSGLEIIWEATQKVISQNQLPKNCLVELVQQLCTAEEDFGAVALKYSSKVALLSDDPQINGYMMRNLSSLLEKDLDVTESRDYDNDLLARLIPRGLVAQVVLTPLYGPLVTYLSETGDKTQLRKAVEQLETAGFYKEAASLTVMQSSVPKALQSISSVLKTYKKWL